MTIERQKVQIDVETTTEGAVRGMDRVANATDQARKAVEKNDAAIKRASLDYQIAQARAENLAATQSKLAAKTREAVQAFEHSGRAFSQFNPAISSAGTSLGSLAVGAGKVAGVLGIATAAGVGAASMAADLAQESLGLQNVFNNLPFSLNAARDATRGLADDATLAKNAIMANQSGVATSAKAYAELVGMAQTLALKMGRDVSETVERVTLGLAKQQREILDELVIIPRMEDMWEQYAKTIGKATKDLTDHEKNTAFTTIAMDAMRQATKGVEVDMDGAAGAIARATVEVKNLKTAALGGVEAERSLAEGVRGLDAYLLRQVAQMRANRVSFYEVEQALQDMGVSTEEYRNNAVALERDIQGVLKAESRRLVNLAEDKKLTAEQGEQVKKLLDVKGLLSDVDRQILQRDLDRLNATKAQQEAAAKEAAATAEQRKQRMLEVEEQIAFGKGAKINQLQLNMLIAEEAELRAQVLEAEGKQKEAVEARRKAQLTMLENEGQLLHKTEKDPGKAERQKRAREKLERQNRVREALREQWEVHNALANAIRQRRADIAEDYDPTSKRNLERQLANVVDFEDKRAQIVLASRMREVAEMRANGLDPAKAAELEMQAKLSALAVEEQVAQRRFEREIMLAEQLGTEEEAARLRSEREIALLEYQDQAEALYHDAEMARIEERVRKEEETTSRRRQLIEESSELVLGAAEAVVQGAAIQGGALKAQIAATAKAEALRHGLILGPSELIRAAIAAAGGNIPGAIAHARNAGKSFAFAAAMGAIAVGAGGVGRRGGREIGGGFGAGAFGGGPAANTPPPSTQNRSASTNGRPDLGGDIPISPETQGRVSAQAAQFGLASRGVVVNMGGINVSTLGNPDEQTIATLERATRQAAQRAGRMVAGGKR